MVNAARKYDRVFQTGSMQRSWPEFRQTAELVRNGYIGEVKTIKVTLAHPHENPTTSPQNQYLKAWIGTNGLAQHTRPAFQFRTGTTNIERCFSKLAKLQRVWRWHGN